MNCEGFWVCGIFRVWGLGFRVYGIQGFGFRVYGIQGLGFRVYGIQGGKGLGSTGFRVSYRLVSKVSESFLGLWDSGW